MLFVRDIMTESVVTLAKDTPVREAAATLSNMRVSGAPVCDERGRVVGVFSKSDIVTKLGDEPLSAAPPVGELMTPHVLSVQPTDPLKAAVWLMVSGNVHRLMVVEGDNQLVGILSPMDVLKAIVSGKLTAPDLDG